MKNFGKELILDIHKCNSSRFNRENIDEYFHKLCDLIDMVKCERFWWDYENEQDEYDKAPIHLKGISAVQFISTSNITIHTLDVLGKVYLNIFSCKDFDADIASEFSAIWFRGEIVNQQTIERI